MDVSALRAMTRRVLLCHVLMFGNLTSSSMRQEGSQEPTYLLVGDGSAVPDTVKTTMLPC